MSDSSVRPFTVAIPDSDLEDLRSRLRNTRWGDAEVVDDWSQGIPFAYVQEVATYWAEQYDWRSREALLNRFDQYVTEVDGLDIHFQHVRSPHEDAVPLLLSHGWPGSIVEFQKVIEPLTNPTAFGGDAADAFHVVVPSLPGFGFSGRPTTTGWGVERIGAAFAALMARLGYSRYVAQGGDWGSAITSVIGATDPDHCAMIELTLAMSARPTGEPSTPAELHAVERIQYYMQWDSGYSTQQRTRPQTVGYGLTDSPVGQLAWILEKFWAWTDCDGHPENVLSRDELLDNVMLYWLPRTATSSARIYWESFGRGNRPTVDVPTGFAVYPKEIVPPVREWVKELYPNVVHWQEYEKGGHFAAFEVPETFVRDLRECFPARKGVVVKTVFKLFGGVFVAVLALGVVFLEGMRRKSPVVLDAVRKSSRATKSIVLKSAGTAGSTSSVVHHVGRKSGTIYQTPIDAVPTDDGFVIALPYGANTDWLKNVLASGSASIVHDGKIHAVEKPEIVSRVDAEHLFPESTQRTLRLFKVDICLRVRHPA